MNDRMRQLAEQVGIAIWGDAVYTYNPHDTLDYAVLSKFTELIVKETMQVVANQLPNNQYLDVAHAVIEHFGVKE